MSSYNFLILIYVFFYVLHINEDNNFKESVVYFSTYTTNTMKNLLMRTKIFKKVKWRTKYINMYQKM